MHSCFWNTRLRSVFMILVRTLKRIDTFLYVSNFFSYDIEFFSSSYRSAYTILYGTWDSQQHIFYMDFLLVDFIPILFVLWIHNTRKLTRRRVSDPNQSILKVSLKGQIDLTVVDLCRLIFMLVHISSFLRRRVSSLNVVSIITLYWHQAQQLVC